MNLNQITNLNFMNTEKKAKAYDKAIEKAKEYLNSPRTCFDIEQLYNIFPELRESDDEVIRKAILELIRQSSEILDKQNQNNMITWLEKQGEKTSTWSEDDERIREELIKHLKDGVEGYMPAGSSEDYTRWLSWVEQQDKKKDNNKLIWKHWSGCGIAGNGDGTQIYLIKQYNTYSVCSCLSSECDYILLSDLDKLISGGDTDVRYKYLEEILKADDIYQISMNDAMVDEAKSKATEALSKMAIGELLGIKNQDEQKPYDQREECLNCQFNYAGECKGSCAMKRSEQNYDDNVKPKFSKGDCIIRNTDGYIHNTYYIKDVFDDYYVCTELNSKYNVTFTFKEAHNTFKLWSISDAKDGDVLVEDSCLFIIKKLNDDFSADTYCVLHVDGDYENNCRLIFDYKDTYPATKEQCEVLFNRIKMENYEWDPEKKELKKLNIKPKFNEGDWVVDEEDNSVHQIKQAIENVTYGGFSYDLTDNGYFPYTKSNYHLWTINDAKDGDVVVVPSIEGSEHSEQIFIFKEIKNRDYVKNVVEYYCKVCDNEFYVNKRGFMGYADDYFVPATQEQRKLLFQKMKEAGYKWDDSKRKIEENSFKSDKVEKALHKAGYEWSEDTHELKKIEQKHTCSEKDDNFEVTDKNEDPSLFDNYNPYKVAVQHIIATCYEYEDVIDTDTYAAKFHDEIIAKCNNAIEYDNKYPKKKSLNVDDLNNIQSITKILNNAKKYYCNDDEIVRGIEWVNSLKNI